MKLLVHNLLNDSTETLEGVPEVVEQKLRARFRHQARQVPEPDLQGLVDLINRMSTISVQQE